MGSPTAYEIKLMRHALGMDGRNPFYRNYFAASPGFEDDEHWQRLKSIGLAYLRMESNDTFPCQTYGVTEEGKRLIRRLQEKQEANNEQGK